MERTSLLLSKELNMTAELTTSYGDFIQEAFIKPIRSVLIIDDDYPTIEQILECQISRGEQRNYQNPQQVLNVIKGFRQDHPALIVDIHDGSLDVQNDIAKYLHQSDLLILDYELGDQGEKSIEITSKVFSNAHFNLIVVHTNSDPARPFKMNLFALLSRSEYLQTEENKVRILQGKEYIEQAEGQDPEIMDRVREAVGFQQYIHFRHPGANRVSKALSRGDPPFGDFKAICDKEGWGHSKPFEIFLCALLDYEVNNADSFGEGSTVAENWTHVHGDRLWIRTNKGFITFVKKVDNINLLQELTTSLTDWNPSPSRLLSAKLRAELDDQGVIAEDKVLEKKLLHAKFYKDLFDEPADESAQVAIEAQIGRQLGDMGNLVKKNVMPFMKRLVEFDKTSGNDSDFIKNYGVDFNGDKQSDAIKIFNAYVSCYPEVNGWHLAPGHIFSINGEVWVCLSPSCDLVPGQKKSTGIYADVGDGKPFLAVKLHKREGVLDGKKINSNNFIFLPSSSVSGAVDCYGFYEGSGSDPDKSLSPHWNVYIAENGGRFNPDDRKIGIAKISCDRKEVGGASEGGQENLNFAHYKCELVAQLRYEYALNLIQKFGAEQTRVGLGYISS